MRSTSYAETLEESSDVARQRERLAFEHGLMLLARLGLRSIEIDRNHGRGRCSKCLSNQSFSPISDNCSADLAAGHDAQPGVGAGRAGQRDDGQIPAVGPAPRVEDALELAPAAQPPGAGQGIGGH